MSGAKIVDTTGMRVFRIALCASLAGWVVGTLAWVFLFPPWGAWPRSLEQAATGVIAVAGAVGIALVPAHGLAVLPFTFFLRTRSQLWHPLPGAVAGAAGALALVCVYACLMLNAREEAEIAARSFGVQLGVFVALVVGATTGSVATWLTRLESPSGSRRTT